MADRIVWTYAPDVKVGDKMPWGEVVDVVVEEAQNVFGPYEKWTVVTDGPRGEQKTYGPKIEQYPVVVDDGMGAAPTPRPKRWPEDFVTVVMVP